MKTKRGLIARFNVNFRARDPRVKAFVSQVGSMDARWAIQNPELRKLTFEKATQRARGVIRYPKPLARFGGMTGQPVWEKLMRYAPIEGIHHCDDCARLFITAENEELFDNKDHAIAAFNQAGGVKKPFTVKGIEADCQTTRVATGFELRNFLFGMRLDRLPLVAPCKVLPVRTD